MGRTANIKRARKLKEAKKRREQDALTAAGLSSTNKGSTKRNTLTEVLAAINPGNIKYSELFKQFMQPVVEKVDDMDTLKIKYFIGVYAWNVAVTMDMNKEAYNAAKKDLSSSIPPGIQFEELFDNLIEHKKNYFEKNYYLISNFDLKANLAEDFYELTVTIIPLNF